MIFFFLKREGLQPPRKGRVAVPRRINKHISISFSSIYAYQISAFYLEKQKSGAFGPMQEPFCGPEGVNPHICISLYLILYEQYAY